MKPTRDQKLFTISKCLLIGMTYWYRSALCSHPASRTCV